MDRPGVEKAHVSPEDANHLNRNRSFKTKQLVRSQAIRETASPPRTESPAQRNANDKVNVTPPPQTSIDGACRTQTPGDADGNYCTDGKDDRKQPVEIQITSGTYDNDGRHSHGEQRQRARRWAGGGGGSGGNGGSGGSGGERRDLLTNSPRVACVCGACAACAQCRGRRRRNFCSTKQDSGIACSDECPECSENEHNGITNNDVSRNATSLDGEELMCRCPERKEKPKNISLSRTDSDDRYELSGPELVEFLRSTLNKNPRDRSTLLRIERELHALVADTGRCIVRFPVMTSYGRMLVHRCAALFQLSHHLDPGGKTSVLVSKSGTSGGRIPCTSFKEWCVVNFPHSPPPHGPHGASHGPPHGPPHAQTHGQSHGQTHGQSHGQSHGPSHGPPQSHGSPHGPHGNNVQHAKSILKRATQSLDGGGEAAAGAARSKSLEQRERDYERVRRRIFSTDNCSTDESQWPWISGPVKLLTPEGGRNKLVKVASLETPAPRRGSVAKSHSFGGYGLPPPRLLSRQGDLASSSWRLSPSSSGYKTLSLRSTDSVTPSPTGGASPEPAAAGAEPAAVVWAVTDLAAVPPGAVVIHPQTGRALTNPDGSLYHFDPANPPVCYEPAQDHKSEMHNEKRRGRLEKQHSFIENGVACGCAGGKCCCECRRDCTRTSEKETNTQATSPIKQRYEQNAQTTTTNHASSNHKPPCDTSSNQTPACEPEPQPPANQRRVYDTHTNRNYETTNHVAQNDKDNATVKVNNVDSQEMQYAQNYSHGYANEEVASPQVNQYLSPEMISRYDAQNTMPPAKLTPLPGQDPNIRPMSVTNILYQAAAPQPYQYINQYRMDAPMPQMYHQPVAPPEDHKQHADNTFRIDPSYPYALECGAACGACDVQPRSYSVPYQQVEAAAVQYPVGNVLMPQPALQPYQVAAHQYQEPMQWVQPPMAAGKLYPVLHYPGVTYPHYSIYPQMVPQQYQLCQPVYQTTEKPVHRPRHTSLPTSTRHTPHEDRRMEDERSKELSAKIQQIKEQIDQTHIHEDRRGDRRRNSGHGILGSYHASNYHNPRFNNSRPAEEGGQLSSAARAIVNSIRNMQTKTAYPDRRPRTERTPSLQYRPPYVFRQMSPGAWCRRSPAPLHAPYNNTMNSHPRRQYPDNRNGRR